VAVNNIIHYTGEQHVPQDIRRRRMQVMQNMLRMGTPVIGQAYVQHRRRGAGHR
jgi:hypothetical protein